MEFFKPEQATARIPTKPSSLSDHHPFIVQDNNHAEAVALVWNMLVKMKGKHFFNNGFACKEETDEQYANRLQHIAEQIKAVMLEHNQLPFICLQETPKTQQDFDAFNQALEINYPYVRLQNENTPPLVTYYNPEKYTLVSELTIPLNAGLQQRAIPLVFQNKTTDEYVLLVNVHADFLSEITEDILTIMQYAKNNQMH